MQPTPPPSHPIPVSTPNVELLYRLGWSIGTFTGSYCLAWRGRDEVVFEWTAHGWQRLGGRGGIEYT
jgi:hypothetical protein